MLSELGRAIREGEVVLHLQPKVALQHGFVEGFEALVRWRHSRLGLLSSGQFVPFAEATDLVHPLTCWVVREALEQRARWNGPLPRLTMGINLSMRDLLDRSCPDELAGIVREAGVNPGVVELELTETAIMADPELALTALASITASGGRTPRFPAPARRSRPERDGRGQKCGVAFLECARSQGVEGR